MKHRYSHAPARGTEKKEKIMQIYIKNNKYSAIRCMISRIVDADSVVDELGNKEHVGYVYYRPTSTGRRVWSGSNSWDLYYVEVENPAYMAVEHEADQEADFPGVCLGNYGGRDIGFRVERILDPKIQLPNGEWLPPATKEARGILFTGVYPESIDQVQQIYDFLPFHQPGGEGSSLECPDAELGYLREWTSQFAKDCPADFRSAVGQLKNHQAGGNLMELRLEGLKELYLSCRLVHYDLNELAYDPYIHTDPTQALQFAGSASNACTPLADNVQ